MSQSPEEIEDYLRSHHMAVIATIRRDGRPQTTLISYLYEDGRLLITTTRTRAKYKNIRRDSRVTLCILDQRSPYGFGYMTVYGRAQPIEDEEQVIEITTRLFRSWGGQIPPDLADYLRREQRIIVAVTPDGFVTQPDPSALARRRASG